MAFTINKLAKLSGVTVRTLRFYDEIGLLKPAYYGDNNYRYYEEEQLLLLQQILFYRQLNFSLSDIGRILSSPDFDKVGALESHRKILKHNLKQTKHLIETIDKTIAHLRGEYMLKLEEVFDGFDAGKQKQYEDFLLEQGVKQSVIEDTKSKINNWTKSELHGIKKEGDEIYHELILAIQKGLKPDSVDVQQIIKKHYLFTKKFWTPNKESYIGLGELYSSHPDFKLFYEKLHSQLLAFLVKAMRIFAENELS